MAPWCIVPGASGRGAPIPPSSRAREHRVDLPGARRKRANPIYEKTATGYSAYAPDLPGCIAGGFTFEETAELMHGAIQMHLEAMREDGDLIPEPTTRADYIEAPAA